MCLHVFLLAICALDGEKASTDTSIGWRRHDVYNCTKAIVLKERVLSHIKNSRRNAFMFHVNVEIEHSGFHVTHKHRHNGLRGMAYQAILGRSRKALYALEGGGASPKHQHSERKTICFLQRIITCITSVLNLCTIQLCSAIIESIFSDCLQ